MEGRYADGFVEADVAAPEDRLPAEANHRGTGRCSQQRQKGFEGRILMREWSPELLVLWLDAWQQASQRVVLFWGVCRQPDPRHVGQGD